MLDSTIRIEQQLRPIVRAYLWRGAMTWLGTRAVIGLVMAPVHVTPFGLSAGGSIEVIALTAALCYADVVRQKEQALLGNLGVSLNALLPLCAVPAMLGEIAVHTIAHLWT